MLKKKRVPTAVTAAVIIVLILVAGFLAFKTLEGSNRNKASGSSAESEAGLVLAEDEEAMPAWVPYAIDNTTGSALDGFLYKGTKVQTASSREASESGNNEDGIINQIEEKVPHYPFDQIPLLKPDMLVQNSEKTIDEDISVSVLYYTKSTVDEALAFYREKLGSYKRFQEDVYDSSTGKSYNLSFAIEIDGKYEMDASVMIMEMPESTGYTCSIMAGGAIRGIAKQEVQEFGLDEDGLPTNFPANIVPPLNIEEIYDAQGDSQGCYIQFDSSSTYDEAIDFYREKLSDKTDFTENNDTEGEISFYCLVPGWEIDVRIMNNEGDAYVEINCYVQ